MTLKMPADVMEFPVLSRDAEGLWLDTGTDILQHIKNDLFKMPRFGIILPGLGRFAVRSSGLEGAVENTVNFAATLPSTRSFTVNDVGVDFTNNSYVVGLIPGLSERMALNAERKDAQTALGSNRSQDFHMMAVLQTKDLKYANAAADILSSYFNHHIDAAQLTLEQPTLTIRK